MVAPGYNSLNDRNRRGRCNTIDQAVGGISRLDGSEVVQIYPGIGQSMHERGASINYSTVDYETI